MSQQDHMRNMLGQLAELDSTSGGTQATPVAKDELTEQLAAEYHAYLGEFGASNSTSSQAKPAAGSMAGNTAVSGATTLTTKPAVPTTQNDNQTQQELEKNIAQLKPALGANIDPKKAAQALQAAAGGQPTSTTDATKGLAPALGKMLADPSLAGQFKNLLNKLK